MSEEKEGLVAEAEDDKRSRLPVKSEAESCEMGEGASRILEKISGETP